MFVHLINMNHAKTFIFGFCQVALVSVSTYAIAHRDYLLAGIVAFGISWIWTANVRRAAVGSTLDRFLYASGAALGSMVGIVFGALWDW